MATDPESDWNQGRYYTTRPEDLQRVLENREAIQKTAELEQKVNNLNTQLRQAQASRDGAIISAYYTSTGSGGVVPEREYWQLVDAYKSWIYTSFAGRSIIRLPDGKGMQIRKIVQMKYSGPILSRNPMTGKMEEKKIVGWFKNPLGDRRWFKIFLKSSEDYKKQYQNKGIILTDDHKLVTRRGMVEVRQLLPEDEVMTRFWLPNKKQKEIILGIMLGDSHVSSGTHSPSMIFSHTVLQVEWFDLKVKALTGLNPTCNDKKGFVDKKGVKHLPIHTCWFETSPYWRKKRHQWYKENEKILPDLSSTDLTPLVLATWYMDDGSLCGRAAMICTNSFSKAEVQKLIKLLKKIGIQASMGVFVKGRRKPEYIIRIGNGYAGKGKPKQGPGIKFFKMIARYIPPTMRYKLPEEVSEEKKYQYDPSLWETGNSEPFYDYVSAKPIDWPDRTTYCIEVEEIHTLISSDIVCGQCVDKIAKSIAMLPFNLYVYRSKQTGKVIRDISWKMLYRQIKQESDRKYFLKNQNLEREHITQHPFLELIAKPNDFMTRFDLWYETMVRIELGGLCGWLKVQDNIQVTRQIYPLPLTKYARIRAKARDDMTLEFWEYQDGNVYQRYPPEKVFMMRYPHPASPFQGMSPVMAQIYPYDIDLFLMQQQVSLFKRGAVPGLHMTTDKELRGEQVKELSKMINEQFEGSLQAGKTLITHSGLHAEPIGETGRESRIDAVERFARDKIITAFDLSPGKIGLVEDINRANMYGLDRTFIRECLTPKAMLMDESIETRMLPDYDAGLTCDFELPSIEDQEFELKAMETRLRNYVTVVDEERKQLGLDPATTYDGSRPWMSMTEVQPGDIPPQASAEAGKGEKHWQVKASLKMMDRDYWTDQRREIHWKLFVLKSEKLELLFLKPLRAYFKNLGAEVVKRLEREGKKILGQYAGWSRQKVELHLSNNKVNIRVINLDKKTEQALLEEKFMPILSKIMDEAGSERVRDLSRTVKADRTPEENKQVSFEFNVNDPEVLKYLGDRLRTFSRGVTGTTFDDIAAILREGFAEGLPISTISSTLWEKFSMYDRFRAPLISRTETISAMNRADLEAVDQLELTEKLLKHWLTAGDENVRDTHVEAGAAYMEGIPMNEEFQVGGDSMLHPGGGSLPEENIQCRCHMFYSQKD